MDKYKTFLPRIAATFIDWLLMILVFYLVSSIKTFYIDKLILIGLLGIVSALYVILMHTFYGQTLGKMLVGVKVVDDTERPVFFGQAVLRSLPQLAYVMFIFTFAGSGDSEEGNPSSAFIAVFWVLYFLFQILDIMLFMINDKHRSLHDFIAGTVVIRTDK